MFYPIKFSQITKLINKHYFLSVAILIVIFSSCAPALKFSPVRYDAASINKLLADSGMKYLTLIYNSENSNSYKNPFSLISYARDSKGGYLDIPPYDLKPDDKKPATFNGRTIIGNLTLERDSIISLLKLSKTGEIIKEFKYLLFTPLLDHEYNYLYYEIKVVGASFQNDKPLSIKVSTRPCPPAVNCRPTTPQ